MDTFRRGALDKSPFLTTDTCRHWCGEWRAAAPCFLAYVLCSTFARRPRTPTGALTQNATEGSDSHRIRKTRTELCSNMSASREHCPATTETAWAAATAAGSSCRPCAPYSSGACRHAHTLLRLNRLSRVRACFWAAVALCRPHSVPCLIIASAPEAIVVPPCP